MPRRIAKFGVRFKGPVMGPVTGPVTGPVMGTVMGPVAPARNGWAQLGRRGAETELLDRAVVLGLR
jgi:hypothetical protein